MAHAMADNMAALRNVVKIVLFMVVLIGLI